MQMNKTIASLIAFLIALGLLCFACDCKMHKEEEAPIEHPMANKPLGGGGYYGPCSRSGDSGDLEICINACHPSGENESNLSNGYLSSPFQCDCGYVPAISHDNPDDCIRYLKRRLGACK
jgi:hypothetical protein